MEICHSGDKTSCCPSFVRMMSIFFGIWILYAGLIKWIQFGPSGFIGWIGTEFKDTFLPPISVTLSAWIIIIAEPLLGLWLLSGKHLRCAWSSVACLRFLLTMGQSILMKPTVADNWFYLVLAAACAGLSPCEKKAST